MAQLQLYVGKVVDSSPDPSLEERAPQLGAITTRYEGQKQAKSSSLLPSALCILPCFFRAANLLKRLNI